MRGYRLLVLESAAQPWIGPWLSRGGLRAQLTEAASLDEAIALLDGGRFDAAVLVLERSGQRVLSAPDGPEAIRTCESSSAMVDIVFCDHQLPRMTGKQLIEQLAMRGSVRFLFTSAADREYLLERGTLHKRDAFIARPFSPAELVRCVNPVLRRAPRLPGARR